MEKWYNKHKASNMNDTTDSKSTGIYRER